MDALLIRFPIVTYRESPAKRAFKPKKSECQRRTGFTGTLRSLGDRLVYTLALSHAGHDYGLRLLVFVHGEDDRLCRCDPPPVGDEGVRVADGFHDLPVGPDVAHLERPVVQLVAVLRELPFLLVGFPADFAFSVFGCKLQQFAGVLLLAYGFDQFRFGHLALLSIGPPIVGGPSCTASPSSCPNVTASPCSRRTARRLGAIRPIRPPRTTSRTARSAAPWRQAHPGSRRSGRRR